MHALRVISAGPIACWLGQLHRLNCLRAERVKLLGVLSLVDQHLIMIDSMIVPDWIQGCKRKKVYIAIMTINRLNGLCDVLTQTEIPVSQARINLLNSNKVYTPHDMPHGAFQFIHLAFTRMLTSDREDTILS